MAAVSLRVVANDCVRTPVDSSNLLYLLCQSGKSRPWNLSVCSESLALGFSAVTVLVLAQGNWKCCPLVSVGVSRQAEPPPKG